MNRRWLHIHHAKEEEKGRKEGYIFTSFSGVHHTQCVAIPKMKKKRNQSTNINTKKPNKRLRTDLNETDESVMDDQDESLDLTDEINTNADTSIDSLSRGKSNVWTYAHRHPTDPGWAICELCPSSPIPKRISTKGGATSTLRKHLVKTHNKTDLLLVPQDGKRVDKVSNTERNRLHQLLINAIIVDGRCFSDFRKSGFSRFLEYAVPGELRSLE